MAGPENAGAPETPTVSDQDDAASAADLFELLERRGHLSEAEAEQARRRTRRSRVPPQQALLDLGTVSQEAIFRGVADVARMPYVVLSNREIPEELTAKIPAKVVLHFNIMPLEAERGTMTIAFSSPPDTRERENLRLLIGARVKPVIASPVDINRTIKRHYGLGADTVVQIREDVQFQERVSDVNFDRDPTQSLEEDDESALISRLVNQILLEALQMKATDVHVEPYLDNVRIRYRIDGFLREIPTPPEVRQLHSAIISRLKIMANLNIAERRLPHDGRVRVSIGGQEYDLRVSILPTRFGETLNLRILSSTSGASFDLEGLGLEEDQLAILTRLLELPHGMILVTGPTGSGKSTTLYGSLKRANRGERKIITVENPIEYQMVGISQIQTHEEIGLTFASCLRSILRHDPDVILIGEIRDDETAEIAIRSALTGHLVLSTLHTNDSVGAVNRLIDMDVEPYLVASSLSASLAQRLVRRICPHCKVDDDSLTDSVLREIASTMECDKDQIKAFRGSGCVECDHVMDEELEDMVTRRATTTDLRAEALKRGMTSLRQDGWRKVMKGLTTVDEVLRITTSVDIHY
jgi:general secretion pathway protein E/type IV pilus assembly protein PilB